MSRLLSFPAALAVSCSLAACNTMSDTAYYVPAGPNPPPPLGYRVECTSSPDLTYVFVHSFGTGCHQIVPPQEPTAVVRARG